MLNLDLTNKLAHVLIFSYRFQEAVKLSLANTGDKCFKIQVLSMICSMLSILCNRFLYLSCYLIHKTGHISNGSMRRTVFHFRMVKQS